MLLNDIPKRYIKAKISDLSDGLAQKLKTDTDSGVLLWGSPGIGKTYAMAALMRYEIANGFTVSRIHYEELCLKLRDTFNPNATQTEWQIIQPLLQCDKLFIEDVGTTKSIGAKESDFSRKTFLVLIDLRLERCLPTYITSNKSVENLAHSFDARIGDRLRMYEVLELKGKSKRGL